MRSYLRDAQNGKFLINLVYPGGGTMVATSLKVLDCGLFENPENAFSSTFDSSKVPWERVEVCIVFVITFMDILMT